MPGRSIPPRPRPRLSAVESFGFAKPYLWLYGGSVAPPKLPLVGDLNGDGYADLLYVSPNDRSVEGFLNGRGWKPLKGQTLLSDLPEGVRAACIGGFLGEGLDLALLCGDGSLLLAQANGAGGFLPPKAVAETGMPDGDVSLLPVRSGDRTCANLLVVAQDGRARVFDAAGRIAREFVLPGPIEAAACGDVNGDGMPELACRMGSEVVVFGITDRLAELVRLPTGTGPAALAVGDVNGDGKADVLVDGVVYVAPDFRQAVAVPGWGEISQPVLVQLADVSGNGRADVVIHRRGEDGYGATSCDVTVSFSYLESDPDWDFDGLSNEDEAKLGTDPLDRDTDKDGLLDGWEVHGFEGTDFAALGAHPLQKDLVVQNLVLASADDAKVREYMDTEIVPFFAALPYPNLNGTQGFALHYENRAVPYPDEKFATDSSWERVAKEEFLADRRGAWHWMLVSGLGRGGQSEELYDAGTSGMQSWIHEFGHQLGLSHSGHWKNWSPTYTSLMNYIYSYRFDDDPKKIHFSRGELADIVLNEVRLKKKVARPIADLHFLSVPPLNLRMQPAGPNETYVDWDWSGVFEDRTISCCITYGYGMSGGMRHHFRSGKEISDVGPFEEFTDYAPELVTHRDELYLLVVRRDGPLDPTAPRPATAPLVMYLNKGENSWGERLIAADECCGDPAAVSDGEKLYVFYPTAAGIAYRCGQPDKLGAPRLIPDTQGAAVRTVKWGSTVFAFLHFGADKAVQYCPVTAQGAGEAKELDVQSVNPPGPAVDTRHKQLLLGTAQADGTHPDRWQLRRFRWDRVAKEFRQVSWEWIGGEDADWCGNRRVIVLFDDRPECGPEGRVHVIGRVHSDPSEAAAGFAKVQTIAYKDVNGGWLYQRYYDQWTNTRNAVGATWWKGDIALAVTWSSARPESDGGLYVAYGGLGAQDADMADFDDITLMAEFGMQRSIQFFTEMPSTDCTGKLPRKAGGTRARRSSGAVRRRKPSS